MTRKQKSYKELETENTRGKKRYIERLIEDEEAAQRIEDFFTHPEQENTDEDRQANHPFN